ncbi:MAG: glycoside hydrolase family 99-like domain-containing protein [Burkholderiales bacterium]|nr:glycoside hydrolase family 99-like domain-containing protein [Burkholderiales bacterium]
MPMPSNGQRFPLRREKKYGSTFERYYDTTLHRHPDYTDRKSSREAINTSIKLIAFYLPQFHPIPENNEWWGEGFTEWTNVSKSVPQFDGHHQPHLPGELGFYDLRLPEVQKQQAELARLYGVYGFCFYHYWFGGRKLLERPMEQLLAHPEIDINFCLCWANENWTRRWDGLEEHILLGQNHSDEDDAAFIADIAKAFRDPRYIRVEGKPLLMLYRPKLLPNPLRTSNIWRDWCRNNGIGEIFLVTVQSFDVVDPKEIGFDAATEFPPLNFPIRAITDTIKSINPDFTGTIYDYRVMAAKSESYDSSPYELYRAVMPSWDNSARRPGNGHIHFYSEPKAYEQWLHNACTDSVVNLPESRRFVFVNAWNEWAEGAHLEPDRHYGYAYLDATAKVLTRHPKAETSGKFAAEKIAIVLHLYYTDLWSEIRESLANLPEGFRLFITLDQHVDEMVVREIRASYPYARIYKKENRGRDILPFIDLVLDIKKFACEYVCKIHSKKSLHLMDGNKWRRDIYDKLLGSPSTILDILKKFESNPAVGIIGPEAHLLDVEYFWGTNKQTVLALASEFDLGTIGSGYKFVAGSMFWARTSAIEALAEMGLQSKFEEEKGQIDGTLAHAIERLIPLVASSRKFITVDTSTEVEACAPPNAAGGKKYAYAKGMPD